MLKIIKEDSSKDSPWYAEGLSFSCTGCGKCCTGAPGFVWVTEEEMEAIASFLKLTLAAFIQTYVRKVKGKYSLIERPENYDCIFLKEGKCEIYAVRPVQCKTYPWWPQNLKSRRDWLEAARFCEGIQETAPPTPLEEIEAQLSLSKKIFPA